MSLSRQRHRPATSKNARRTAGQRSAYNGVNAVRPAVLLLAKTLFLPLASAAPTLSLSLLPRSLSALSEDGDESPKSPDDPNLYVYLGIAIALVLLGGAFAGLTIALMGQDETYLQVIATSGEGSERKHAEKVLGLLNRGKHWVLVTLLLSNVITNETLPIVLDRSLGGGWPAVLSSTVLIVIFGEIVPQSVCVRYGLSIGSFMAPLVLILMWIMSPVAWPTAKLLDWLLGADHGTMYKKAGLKTLVQLHKTLGAQAGERLMEDEVTIINSVLDLKEKPVGDIMTPMQDVFTMSADTVLDERMMDTILSQGYSRIPIYAPDNNRNFIGMLLVKILITYDPEDGRRVREFALATLPETAPYTSCLDIINFFQEGKSHMVLVSDFPGQDKGALGVVTLEDVIEELIGEEIIDESDVFVDVHKAIRRLAPAPKQKFHRHPSLEPTITHDSAKEASEDEPLLGPDSRKASFTNGGPQPPTSVLVRRKSSTASANSRDGNQHAIPVRQSTAEMREHLRHLGPSNVATRPRATKFASVKIKPGVGTIPEGQATTKGTDAPNGSEPYREQLQRSRSVDMTSPQQLQPPITPLPQEGEGAGKEASDGVPALRQGYGTMESSKSPPSARNRDRGMSADAMSASEASRVAEQKAQPLVASPGRGEEGGGSYFPSQRESQRDSADRERLQVPEKIIVGDAPEEGAGDEGEGSDQVGELAPSRQRSQSRRQARSGSITETTVDIGGISKTVLETTSSSSDLEDEGEDEGKDGEADKEEGGGSSNRRRSSIKKKKQEGKKGSGSSN